jgi:hypothetical protein
MYERKQVIADCLSVIGSFFLYRKRNVDMSFPSALAPLPQQQQPSATD